MEIAYLGPKGSFSHQAAQLAFPNEHLQAVVSIPELIEQYENGKFDHALVPIENSIEGPVNVAIDKIYHQSTAQVVAEIVLPIVQNLLVADLVVQPEHIFSHPQALAQAREYLTAHYPNAQIQAVASTGLAAEMVQQNPDKAYGAVANLKAAEYYDLSVLAENIQDRDENNTRFWCLGKQEPTILLAKKADKVSLALTLPENLPGALYKAISTFAWRGIDMTKIESRPLKTRLGQYFFIIDLVSDDKIRFACEEMRSLGIRVRMLGKYKIYEGKK